MNALDLQEYRELMQAALPSAPEADTVPPSLRTLFTPDAHRVALGPDVTIVQGARGVGKTVWFKALQDPVLRQIAADAYQIPSLTKIEPFVGYGVELNNDRYPGPAGLRALVESSCEPGDIWTAVVLHALGDPTVSGLPGWRERVGWVRANPYELDAALARVDHVAGRNERVALILFDALDRLHPSRRVADELTRAILRLALDLRTRTRNLRAKVFIRHDMFESAGTRFPDASKLTANAADLRWSTTNLYGLLFHLLGNASSQLAERFRASTPEWTETGPERHFTSW